MLLVSVTGSILVYRNELYRAATRPPIEFTASGPQLTDEQLKVSAARIYPGYSVLSIRRARSPNQPVTISLKGTIRQKNRLFNPYTGADLGDVIPAGILLVSRLASLHDDLFAGKTGRQINGAGALMVLVMAFTGIVVWWPGIRTWRRSLTVPRNVGWRRFIWGLHGMMGFWSFGFVVVFGLSGIYLGFPDRVQDLADWIDPLTAANARTRVADQVIYWLAYLHFGRINGIGIPCRGPGLCDMTTKLVWALFGLAPAALFVTGTMMWWNRVVRKKFSNPVERDDDPVEVVTPGI